MMKYVVTAMVLLAIAFGALQGRMDAVSNAALQGGISAVNLAMTLAGGLCLWGGVMRIAEASGLTERIARMLRPVTALLFGRLSGEAMSAISMNMVANLLGLGNAATPLGLAAMRELQKENPAPEVASRKMVLFVVLNTASIQLIPTTVALLRGQAGARQPFDILPAVWITSAASVAVGVTLAKLTHRR